MRETSIKAFVELVQSGRLRKKQLEVAKAFLQHGPGTAAEVLRAAGLDRNLNLARARVTELRGDGVLREKGARPCAITNRHAIVYDFDPGPAPPKKISKGAEWRQLAIDALALLDRADSYTVGPWSLEESIATLRERRKQIESSR